MCQAKLLHRPILISDEQGESLVRLARRAIQEYVKNHTIIDSPASDLRDYGVFVTLSSLRESGEQLRGCIGFTASRVTLSESLIQAAIAASSEDPRFSPVEPGELERIIIEVSVLTPPSEIITEDPNERKNYIHIGQDGLILKWRGYSGLLLPQVATEFRWDTNEFLRNVCYKAGVNEETWRDRSAKLYKFQAQIYREKSPGGMPIRVFSN